MQDDSIETKQGPPVDPETVTSKDGVRRRCAGARVMHPDLYAAGVRKRDRLNAANDFDGLVQYARSLAITQGRADKLGETPDLTDVTNQINECLNARKGCGENTSLLCDAVPVDGVVHEITCPRCGTVSTVVRHPDTPAAKAAAEKAQQAKLAEVVKD